MTTILVELRKQRRRLGISINDMARGLAVSKPTISRWLKGQGLTLDALDDICNFLGTDLRALVEQAQENQRDHFSLRQERFLAADRNLSLIFFLVLNGAQRKTLVTEFGFPDHIVDQCLERLVRLGLVRMTRSGGLRSMTSRLVRWRPGGPLATTFERSVKEVFLKMDLSAPDAVYTSQLLRLDARGRQLVQSRFQALCEDVLSATQPGEQAPATGEWSALFMMTRPIASDEMVDWARSAQSSRSSTAARDPAP